MVTQTRKRITAQIELPVITLSHCYENDQKSNIVSYNMKPFNKVPRTLLEENADPLLFNFERQMLGLFLDEQVLATDPRYNDHCRIIERFIIKDDILYRHKYNDVSNISYLQALLPVHLKDTVLISLHGEALEKPKYFSNGATNQTKMFLFHLSQTTSAIG